MFCHQTGKLIYESRGEAASDRSYVSQRRGHAQKILHVYKCPYCKFFHLGRDHKSKPKRVP